MLGKPLVSWKTQPSDGVGIDRGHPLSRGLRRSFNFRTKRNYDLVGNAPVTFLSGGSLEVFPTATFRGVGLPLTVTRNGLVSVPSWTNTTGEASVCLVFQRTTVNDFSPWELGSSADADHFPYAGVGAYLDVFWGSRWINNLAAPSGKAFGDYVTLVFSVKTGAQRAFWDGLLWTSATNAGSANVPATLTVFASGLNGMVYCAHFWDRALSDQEAWQISQNPWQLFQAPSRPLWVPAVTSGTITLSGQGVTTTPGSLAAGISKALTGQALTTSLGTLGKGISKALTGQGLTGSLGSLPRGLSKALSGQGLTISQGTLAPSGAGTAALTGQSLTCSTGTLTVSVSKALSGQVLTSARGSLSPTISLSLSGQSATGTLGTLSPGISKALLGVSLTGSVGNLSISSGTSVLIKAGSWIRYRTL